MGLFGEHERNQIADAIAEVEQRTNAELVAVLAARSDDYRHHSIAWAAALALLMSAPLVFVHPSVGRGAVDSARVLLRARAVVSNSGESRDG